MPEGDASRSVDWYQLRLYVEAGDVEAFTAVVKAHLLHRSTHFKILQRGLQTYCFTQVDSSKALAFACACIMRLLRQSQAQAAGTEGSALALCHLLLELVPCIVKQDAGVLPRVRPAAVDVLKSCWTPGLARLSVKVVQSFGIQAADVGNDKLLLAQIRQLLDDPNTYTPAVGLLMHFQELAAHVDCAAILGKLVAEAQTPLAEKWAAQLPRPLQVAFIEHCLAFDRLKEASKAVRHLGLQQEFPDVEQMYRQRSLARLVDKGLWSVAATFVGEDEAYQEQLVKSMLLAGEVALAEEYRQQFDLDPDVIRIDAAQLAAQDDLLAQTYLQLPLPPGAVHFVDDEAGIARAADALREVDAVGLDVEWQPNHVAGQTSSPASLLQVASRTHVFVIDLIRLHNSPALDACLAGLLQSEGVLKLGCALAGDLKKVAASYPHLGAFQSATRMLDLTGPWRLYMAATDRQTMVSRRSTVSIGLSAMAQSVLGKPLNKSMQVSDWEKRPLTAKQLAYAALDAHVLVQLYDAMTSGSAGLTRQQLLGSVFDFKALREPAGTAHKRARDSDAEEAQPDSLAASDETTTALDSARLPSPGPARTVAEASQSAASPAAQTIDQVSCSSRNGTLAGERDITPALMPASSQLVHGYATSPSPSLAAEYPLAAAPVQTEVPEQRDAKQPEPHTSPSLLLEATRPSNGLLPAVSGGSTASSATSGTVSSSRMLPDAGAASLFSCQPPASLMSALEKQGLQRSYKRLRPFSGSIATAAAAAGVLGIPTARVAKSLAFLVNGRPWLAVLRGDRRLDLRKMADQIGCPRRGIKAASPIDCQQLFGYSPGVLPPGGFLVPVCVLVDAGLAAVASLHQPAGGQPGRSMCGGPANARQADGAPLQQPIVEQHVMPSVRADAAPLQPPCGKEGRRPAGTVDAAGTSTSAAWEQDWHMEPGSLYCGAGSPDAILQLTYPELLQFSGGQVADLVQLDGDDRPANGSTAAPSPAVWPLEGGRQEADAEQRLNGRGLPADGVTQAAAEDGQAANDAGLQLTLDSMCTRLCRWLRCLGVDSEYVGAEVRRAEVPQLAAAATAQGRIFVTRDQKLSARRGTGAVFLLATDDAASQLEELATHFGIRFDEEVVLSRCSKCNAAQFELVEPRERVQGWVPEHVYSRVEEFWQCGRCRKVFWMGPRSQAAIELVGGMLSRMRTQDESPCADFFAEGV